MSKTPQRSWKNAEKDGSVFLNEYWMSCRLLLNALWMKIVNKLLKNICVECFDLLPFRGRRANLLLLSSSCTVTHSMAIFFFFFFAVTKWVTSFHSFVSHHFSLDKFKVYQNRSCSLTQCLKRLKLAVEQEIWCWVCWTFCLCKACSENVDKIVHFIPYCICHSVLCKIVFRICIDGYCNGYQWLW